MPNFPTNDDANGAKMLRGRTQVFIGDFTTPTAGVPNDAPELKYLGLLDDGVEEDIGPEYEDVDGGAEFLAPFTTFRSAEKMNFSFVLRELALDVWGIVTGGQAVFSAGAGPVSQIDSVDNVSGDSTNAGLGNAREMAVGGLLDCPAFYQVVMRHPAESDGVACGSFEGYSIIWKGLIRPTGAISRTRNGIHSLPVSVTGYIDSRIVPAVDTTPGTGVSAYGQLGLVHYPNA